MEDTQPDQPPPAPDGSVATVPQGVSGNTTAAQLQALLADTPAMLPPDARAHTLMQHEILDLFWFAMRIGVPRDDLEGRLSLGHALIDAIRRNQVNDPHPRDLFVLQGRLAVDTARAAFGVFERKSADTTLEAAVERNFNEAAVAFENAYGTTPMGSLVEPVSDVEVLRLLGDVWYAEAKTALARTAYAAAVDRFIEAWEPVEQVLPVTDALARWATVLIDTGACGNKAHPDPVWTDRWTQLGDAPPDVCGLDKRDDGAARPPPLANIQKLIRDAVAECYVPPVPETMAKEIRYAAFKRRLDMLDCYNRKGVNDPSVRFQLSAETIDAEITHALGAQR